MPTADEYVQVLDPFTAAALRQRRTVRPEDGRRRGPVTHILENYLPHVAKGVASLPQRTFEAASTVPYSEEYDPGPALETALGTIGVRVPFAKKGELGVGGGKLTQKPEFDAQGWFTQGKKDIEKIYDIANQYKNKWEDKSWEIISDWNTRKFAGAVQPDPTWAMAVNPFMKEPLNIPAHAVEAGFNPNFPLYKGGYSPSDKYRSLREPKTKAAEQGIFFSADPKIAGKYGDYVTDFVAGPKRPAVAEYSRVSSDQEYGPYLNNLVAAARNKGHDFLTIKGMNDIGGMQDQYVVLDPSIVRRPTAKFDPTRFNENNLLAGLAGGGVIAGSAMDPEVLEYVRALGK